MTLLKAMLFTTALLTGSLAFAEPDPESLQEAEQLLDSIGIAATLDQAMLQMVQMQIHQNPALAPYREIMVAFFEKYTSYESLQPELVKSYAEAFTTVELKEMNAFYSSAVGQKAVQKMPELMAQGAQAGVARVQANMGELQDMMRAEAEKIGELEPDGYDEEDEEEPGDYGEPME